MNALNNVSHVSAPREMRLETDALDPGTTLETGRETATTKLLIAKVLARPQVRQPVRQPVRQGFEPVRQPVRQTPENLTSPRDCSQGGEAVPAHIRAALELGGYERDPTAWTPKACQRFLNQLKTEWPAFKVNGWHGLTMPDNFPVEFRDAVQSVYVQALQDSEP